MMSFFKERGYVQVKTLTDSTWVPTLDGNVVASIVALEHSQMEWPIRLFIFVIYLEFELWSVHKLISVTLPGDQFYAF